MGRTCLKKKTKKGKNTFTNNPINETISKLNLNLALYVLLCSLAKRINACYITE
jgi:hypothetical protein